MPKTNIPPSADREKFGFTIEKRMEAKPRVIYEAWTEKFDLWFAEPGQLLMCPEVDRPYFFYNRKEWGGHPHYGRFTELVQDRLVEMTWVTPDPGTAGTETVLRVELIEESSSTLVKFSQWGFADEASKNGHLENWPEGLDILAAALAK